MKVCAIIYLAMCILIRKITYSTFTYFADKYFDTNNKYYSQNNFRGNLLYMRTLSFNGKGKYL